MISQRFLLAQGVFDILKNLGQEFAVRHGTCRARQDLKKPRRPPCEGQDSCLALTTILNRKHLRRFQPTTRDAQTVFNDGLLCGAVRFLQFAFQRLFSHLADRVRTQLFPKGAAKQHHLPQLKNQCVERNNQVN